MDWRHARLRRSPAYEYTLVNKNYEGTVVLDRNDIEDDQLGVYAPALPALGMEAMSNRDFLLWNAFLNNAFAGNNVAYDGQLFFSPNHPNAGNAPVGVAKTQSNLLANAGKLTPANFNAAYAQLGQVTDEMGRPLGVTPDVLVCGPASREQALLITKAELIQQTSNINRGVVEAADCSLAGELDGSVDVGGHDASHQAVHHANPASGGNLSRSKTPNDDSVFRCPRVRVRRR